MAVSNIFHIHIFISVVSISTCLFISYRRPSTWIITLIFNEFTPSISDEDIAAASLSGKQILLVEDNELNLEIAQFMLEDAGIIVTPAKDGSQALKAFLEKPAGSYDMILMDIMMPVMNGYEATRAIRTSGRKDALTIPIIAVTANAYEEDRQASFAAGMNEHLTKPLNCEKLIATIVKFL